MTTELNIFTAALAAFEKIYGKYARVSAVKASIYGAVIITEDKHYSYNFLTEEITEVKDWRRGR